MTPETVRAGAADDVERAREIYARVLERDRVGPDDDFFRLGGQSLAAVRLVNAVAERCGVDLPVQRVFASPTPRGLAREIAAAAGAATGSPRATATGASVAPLSWQQEWQYRLEQMVPGSPIYNSYARFELVGELDLTRFTAAVLALVRRHEVLRTRYLAGPAGLRQHILPYAEYDLVEREITGLPPDEVDAELERVVGTFTRRGFDLAGDPGLRLLLVHLPQRRHVVLIAVNHINFDGWSRDILLDDLCQLYRATEPAAHADRFDQLDRPDAADPATRGRIRYADFARWQRTRFDADEIVDHLRYWENAVAGGAAPPRPHGASDDASFVSMHRQVSVGPAELARFTGHALDAGATPFIACLAAFGVVLADWLGVERVPVATVTANRTWAATARVVGSFSTVVPIAVDLTGDPTFRELLERCRAAGIEALRHQEFPLELACLTMDGAVTRRLLTGLRFGIALHPPIRPDRHPAPGLRLVQRRVNLLDEGDQEVDPSTFDLTLELRESADGLVGHLAHQVDAVSGGTAAALVGHFREVVRRVSADPGLRLSQLRRTPV